MERFTDFYEAYHFLDNHYIFMGKEGYRDICNDDYKDFSIETKIFFATSMCAKYSLCHCVEVQKVNPETNYIDDNEDLNTKTEVWLECGPYDDRYAVHDIDLDCGGDTYEEATIKLANLVYEKYGDNSWENIKKFFEKED